MDLILVIIGLFMFAAILRNNDFKEGGKWEDMGVFLTIFVLFLVFGGLNFLLRAKPMMQPNFSFLIPIQIGFAAIAVTMQGTTKRMGQLGALLVMTYIIMGSFM
jgi:hypothetical protein